MVTNASSSLKKRAAQLWRRDELAREFKWMKDLSPLHYRPCLVELHSAIAHAHVADDWDPVARLVEDWEATAQMDAAPEVADRLLSLGQKFDDLPEA